MDIHSPAYRKAFIQYLRRGTAIELTLKSDAQVHPTKYYIWRTREDGKVRSSHAANDGKIFAWDDPPPTGNPGDEFGCRCWAEPYYEPDDPNSDLPLNSVYPELLLVPLLRISNRSLLFAINLVRRVRQKEEIIKSESATDHGVIRSIERKISLKEAEEAIRTAKISGNVSTKIGKYGTPQIHYRGTNGVTVIVETTGRNAGKIITFWKNN